MIIEQKNIFKVRGASAYNFTDRETGEIRQGTSIYYESEPDLTKDQVGKQQNKLSAPYELYAKLKSMDLPGDVEIKYTLDITKKNVKPNVLDVKQMQAIK